MSSSLVLQTAVLVLGRFILFLACRNYLLKILYSDLRDISSPSGSRPESPALVRRRGDEDIELETLPLPSTHTPKNASFTRDASYLMSTTSRTIFSWCFAENCTLFMLLILQELGIFSSQARLANWKFSLFFLMATILVVVPLCFSLLLSLGSSEGRALRGVKAFLSLIPVAFYLYGLSFIPLPPGLEPLDLLTATLSRLIVLGIIILGLLSGFGAINSSWGYLPFLNHKQPVPSEREIDTAAYSLAAIKNDIRNRRTEAARRDGNTTNSSWFSRVGSSFRGPDGLSQEIKGLEALEYEMSRKLEALRERRKAALFDNTIGGKLFNLAARLFAVYCVVRFFSSLYNVFFLIRRQSSATTYPDILTEFLAHALSTVSSAQVSREAIASFARQLSLVFVGIIILSSIRMTLRGVTRALHITSRNLAASLMLLVLAQIMSIYLLSTIVQMRATFPPPPLDAGEGSPVDNLFSTIPAYEVFGSLFDWSFIISASVSLFVRWGTEKVTGAGDVD